MIELMLLLKKFWKIDKYDLLALYHDCIRLDTNTLYLSLLSNFWNFHIKKVQQESRAAHEGIRQHDGGGKHRRL